MTRFRSRSIIALTTVGASLLLASQAEAGSVLAGSYQGEGTGVKAAVDVADDGAGRLVYTMRSACGSSRGSLPLASAGTGLKGKRVTRKRRLVVRLEPEGGTALSGSIRYRVKQRNARGAVRRCRTRRAFTVELDVETSPQVQSLAGHYTGAGQDGGRPISFDVAVDASEGGLEIRGMAFETDTECWQDLDRDGTDDTLVARIGGLEGEVDPDGSFSIYHSPDDDTEYSVDGTIADGTAIMELEVGGFFALDGTPLIGGPLECDSWGETYSAGRLP